MIPGPIASIGVRMERTSHESIDFADAPARWELERPGRKQHEHAYDAFRAGFFFTFLPKTTIVLTKIDFKVLVSSA